MKRCPKHYWFEYDETQGGCQLCEREALKARAGVGPIVPTPGSDIPPQNPGPNDLTFAGPIRLEPASRETAASEPVQSEPAPSGSVWGEPAGPAPAPVLSAPTLSIDKPGDPAAPVFDAAPPVPTNGYGHPAEPQATQPAPAPTLADPPRGPQPLATPPPPDPVQDEDTRILNQLTQLRDNGVFTVVLIGFYAGGKTWFLNRVKHELGRWGFNLSPPPADDRQRVIRTVNVEIHHARRLADDQVRGFALVDIPGERLGRLVAKDFRSVRSVIAAMDMCGALIVALPADEVLLSEDIAREAQALRGVDQVLLNRTKDNPALHQLAIKARELVVEAGSVEDALGRQGLKAGEVDRIRALGDDKSEEDRQKLLRLVEEVEALDLLTRVYRLREADAEIALFTQDLCFLTGLMSKLKRDGARIDNHYDFGALDAGQVDVHISSIDYARFMRPTFVAMTKADLVSHPDPLLEALIAHGRKPDIGVAFDEDPLDTVREMRPSLSAMFEQWFGTVKLDFVTAFHQHRQTDRIDYSAGHFGVGAVFDWIGWAQRWDNQSRSERAALARARAIRRSRDGRVDPAKDWAFMNRQAAYGGPPR